MKNNFGKSEFAGISKPEKRSFDIFLANSAKSNRSVDLLKDLNAEKDKRRESVGKNIITPSYLIIGESYCFLSKFRSLIE